jgi:cysteinyl-tRNA synthetase
MSRERTRRPAWPFILALTALVANGRSVAADPVPPASFAYILQADSFAKTKAAAVERFAACGRDWVVIDSAFSEGTSWERVDLDAIRRGRPGRKVIAYISIGEAEDYRPYWRKEWGGKGQRTAAAPAWLGAENPEWKGNYRVKYWQPDWQRLILPMMDSAMAAGFDGVYLDIVDGFETFEQTGKESEGNRVNPETKRSYRRDMVDWVKTIAARVRAKNPNALVIPQNGSQLLSHVDFTAIISAIGIEDLFTNGNKLQSKSGTAEVLSCLKPILDAKKPVLLIEYPKNPERQALSKRRASENGFVWLVTDRELKTFGDSGR